MSKLTGAIAEVAAGVVQKAAADRSTLTRFENLDHQPFRPQTCSPSPTVLPQDRTRSYSYDDTMAVARRAKEEGHMEAEMAFNLKLSRMDLNQAGRASGGEFWRGVTLALAVGGIVISGILLWRSK